MRWFNTWKFKQSSIRGKCHKERIKNIFANSFVAYFYYYSLKHLLRGIQLKLSKFLRDNLLGTFMNCSGSNLSTRETVKHSLFPNKECARYNYLLRLSNDYDKVKVFRFEPKYSSDTICVVPATCMVFFFYLYIQS